ncbi:MAG TPA: UDP-N-acetylmuramoyl-L-alanine--D-glutamate ligase [Dongiaceae bacterium]|nr:UDP-N-acetylmuramoyl-L-alanine--D-glutamate ligase [Dongiaceae bacterium]
MIPVPIFSGRPVAVLGLGRSGLAAARALAAGGAEVWVWDDDAGARGAAAAAGAALVDLRDCDWRRPAALVLSPGIPHTHPTPHPAATAARAAGCEIIGDIELLIRAQPRATIVAVTGTNGKSTTTALIGHLLGAAGRRVEVGGNLGTPALALAPLAEDGAYVLELSSYQLELTPSGGFTIAVLLNISPDHLGRHGGLDGYVAAKKRIFHRQPVGSTAVIGVDDPQCRAIHAALAAKGTRRVVPISGGRPTPEGVYAEAGRLIDDTEGRAQPVFELGAAASLPGAHNWQNAAAAYAASRAMGLSPAAIAAGLASFPGLAHRQELIVRIGDVAYVNDSKATNADAAAKALACYDVIYWILGGRPKEDGLTGLEAFYPRVAHAFIIGEAAEAFAGALAGRVPCTRVGTLDAAVAAAHRLAQAERRQGAVVLLSPACASFDQFADFEDRGNAFRRLVEALAHPGAGDASLATRQRARR